MSSLCCGKQRQGEHCGLWFIARQRTVPNLHEGSNHLSPAQPPPLTAGPPPFLAHTHRIHHSKYAENHPNSDSPRYHKLPHVGIATFSRHVLATVADVAYQSNNVASRPLWGLLCLGLLRGWPAIDMRNIARGNAHFRFAVG